MASVSDYLAAVELALISSPAIAEYRVVRSWANTDDGYLRVRAKLTNGDFLEAAEYFELQVDEVVTVDYRYQWMDSEQQQLQRRWDNTPDHPELENFPHHIHIGSEENVVPGQKLSMTALLKILEQELAQS